ncbi:MAG TPA: ABC-F family ATP-binding cassette domain-containing protein [Caulobacteraceae bacterium]|jgi:ATP-binding cassette subfamily F protein uup
MPAPILQLRGVELADGRSRMFDGVDMTLERGARACLVGRNGVGKSTLLRILAGTLAADDGERTASPGLKVALASQEPQIAGVSLEAFACAGGAAAHAARAALEYFGLDPAAPTEGLSGGEARRAALARAFAEGPDILLLDEPTNHLDIVAIEALEARLARERAAVLVVSHDRAFLERVTDTCFWLDGRRVRRLDAGFAAFEPWAEQILAAEAEAARRLDKAIARDERWLAFGVTGRRARNEGRRRRLEALRADKSERLAVTRGDVRLGETRAVRSGALVLEATGLSKAFGPRTLVRDFSTRIQRGEKVAIIGPNGAGKTTLVDLLLGRLAPDTGRVRLGAGLEIVSVSQGRSELRPGDSLLESLVPGGGDQIMVQGRPRHVAGYAADFLFRGAQLRQPVESLSGGERNRLLLARALARPSNLLVLDEPTNDLDMETLDLLEDLLADYAGTLIVVSHDRDFVERLATSTIALDGAGAVVETPGGWADFVSQNPGFFQPAAAPPGKAAAPRQRTASAKLSYRDERRLTELEAEAAAHSQAIAALERQLADGGLYGRDPVAFDRTTRELAARRAALAAAEDAWLEMEARREALARNREARPG